ncbi:MAG: GNAT family N-acetyltransferase, partial [Aristaeellaceae bacterium]
EGWARANHITRPELTVERPNEAARHLYEKMGFAIEGVRKRSMLVDGRPVDEYYMARLL